MLHDLSKILFNRIQEIQEENNGVIEIQHVDAILTSVTEIIKAYVSDQSEVKVYNDIEKLAQQIKLVKREINELRPQQISDTFIDNATQELQAVTKSAEQSTNMILDQAEKIQSLANKLQDENIKVEINNSVTKIFEACDFQDITGQRITKVTKILEDIENTVTSLVDAMSGKPHKIIKKVESNYLMQGPPLEKDKISQQNADNILKG